MNEERSIGECKPSRSVLGSGGEGFCLIYQDVKNFMIMMGFGSDFAGYCGRRIVQF